MRLRHIFQAAIIATTMAFAGAAFAEDPQVWVHREQDVIMNLLRQPAGPDRDAKVSAAVAKTMDYDEMTRRSFGGHWTELTEEQKAEVSTHLRKIIENAHRKNLIKTLDYDTTFKGQRTENGNQLVRTEAKSKVNNREPPLRVDYVLKDIGNGNWVIVELITEGSRLTRNYGDQFHRMLTTEGQGYPYLLQKLKEKAQKGT